VSFPKINSSPKGQVSGELPGGPHLFVRFDEFCFNCCGNNLRDNCTLAFRKVEPFTQGCVRHAFRHDPFEGTMLVTGSYPIISIHVFKMLRETGPASSQLPASPVRHTQGYAVTSRRDKMGVKRLRRTGGGQRSEDRLRRSRCYSSCTDLQIAEEKFRLKSKLFDIIFDLCLIYRHGNDLFCDESLVGAERF
jgi:hypothetical protein